MTYGIYVDTVGFSSVSVFVAAAWNPTVLSFSIDTTSNVASGQPQHLDLIL
jgi:hypothetical protein